MNIQGFFFSNIKMHVEVLTLVLTYNPLIIVHAKSEHFQLFK